MNRIKEFLYSLFFKYALKVPFIYRWHIKSIIEMMPKEEIKSNKKLVYSSSRTKSKRT